jgi:MFS family permease
VRSAGCGDRRLGTEGGGLGRAFGRLWTANTLSGLGDGTINVAGALLAASLTRDPVEISGLMVAQQLPWMLFALPSGALADRFDRRRLMIVLSAMRAVALGVLAVAVAAGMAGVPLLYVVFFLAGCAGLVFENAATAMLPAVVAGSELERANGRLQAARTLTQELVSGPLGSWLFVLAAWTPFLLDTGVLITVVVVVAGLPKIAAATAPTTGGMTGTQPGLWREMVVGVRWMARHRLLRSIALAAGLSNLGLGAVLSLLVLIAGERLGLGSYGYGLLLTAAAGGGIVGGLLTGRLVAIAGSGNVLRWGLIIEALSHLGLALTDDPVAAGSILAVLSMHLVVFSATCASLRQALVPPELLGRVHAGYRLFSNGGMFAGAALGGVVARLFGLTAPFWLGLGIVAIVTACVWRVLNDRDLRAARHRGSVGG